MSRLLFLALLAAAPAFAQQGLRLELEGAAARERLTAGRGPWTDAALQLEAHEPSRRAWFGRHRETERFGLRDREAGLGLHLPLGGDWAASFDVTASSTHRVLPRHSLFAQAEKRLGGGWGVHFGLRRSEYTPGRADLRLFTLERYYGDQRLAYTLYSGRPEGAGSAPSHRLQWSYYIGERSSLGLSLARGREVENIAPAGLLTSEVRNLTLFGRYWFASRWAMSFEASAHEQGDLYRRHGLRLGLRHQF